MIAAFFALFVVMALRNAGIVGNDSATSYLVEFSAIQNTSLSWPNPGLPFVMKLVHRYLGDYQWVIILTAVWVCFAYYKLLVKYSENGFISVMWFMGMLFYTFLFSALKQAWAMAFLCFAFDAIFEKKPLKFFAFIGLAALFHFPAFVFLPAYLIAKLEINKYYPIIMSGLVIFVYIFRTQILSFMTSLYGGEGKVLENVRFIGTKFVFMIIILLYGLYYYFRFDSQNCIYRTLLYFMGIAAIIQTFCFYNNIFERLADYYYQFSILFMPLILRSNLTIQGYNSKTDVLQSGESVLSFFEIDYCSIFSFIVTSFCVIRFITFTNSGADSLNPYFFFWQG